MSEPDLQFVMRVLNLFAFDTPEPLWWRTDGEYAPITFFINCNDEFWTATADAETITPENIDVLEKAFHDAKEASSRSGEFYAPLLFVARVRKMRPALWTYPKDAPEICKLLDACGPERHATTAEHRVNQTPDGDVGPV